MSWPPKIEWTPPILGWQYPIQWTRRARSDSWSARAQIPGMVRFFGQITSAREHRQYWYWHLVGSQLSGPYSTIEKAAAALDELLQSICHDMDHLRGKRR